MTKTWTVRDIPEDVGAAVEAAASAASSRSREAFVRDFLQATFGAQGSVASGIALRARSAVNEAVSLGRFGALSPAPTLPRIARALGHPNTMKLEGELRGDIPLSFSDGDRLCALLGLDREWLEAGDSDKPRYRMTALFSDCGSLLYDFQTNGIHYDNLYFVLADSEFGCAAIVGQTSSDDPTVGWRYDLLVDEIPVHDRVGGTGKAQRRELADLCVALDDTELFPDSPICLGRIVTDENYMGLVNGYLHPANVVSTSIGDDSKPVARRSDWHLDFAKFRRGEAYTKNYAAGRVALLEDLQQRHITNDEQYRAVIRKELKSFTKLYFKKNNLNEYDVFRLIDLQKKQLIGGYDILRSELPLHGRHATLVGILMALASFKEAIDILSKMKPGFKNVCVRFSDDISKWVKLRHDVEHVFDGVFGPARKLGNRPWTNNGFCVAVYDPTLDTVRTGTGIDNEIVLWSSIKSAFEISGLLELYQHGSNESDYDTYIATFETQITMIRNNGE